MKRHGSQGEAAHDGSQAAEIDKHHAIALLARISPAADGHRYDPNEY
jgi:hypothetical protein